MILGGWVYQLKTDLQTAQKNVPELEIKLDSQDKEISRLNESIISKDKAIESLTQKLNQEGNRKNQPSASGRGNEIK